MKPATDINEFQGISEILRAHPINHSSDPSYVVRNEPLLCNIESCISIKEQEEEGVKNSSSDIA
jgi:hypothetical protein